ncbi:MAG: hypothetical protein JXQ73_28750 [Phycisphaerae bacterium]|nr:hypothetical protein [Phycisphaerae bacterium]
MVRKSGRTRILLILFCASSAGSSVTLAATSTAPASWECETPEERILRTMGLKKDAPDSVVIALLDDPRQVYAAMAVLRLRRLASMTPKFLEIVTDEKRHFTVRLQAAEGLCDCGNREWLKTVKGMLKDQVIKKLPMTKLRIAGLLARGGEYSQFEMVAGHIDHEKKSVRSYALQALHHFTYSNDVVADPALEIMAFVAKSDPEARFRREAIRSLEGAAKTKPELMAKLVEVWEANVDSQDKLLRSACRRKLQKHRGQ